MGLREEQTEPVPALAGWSVHADVRWEHCPDLVDFGRGHRAIVAELIWAVSQVRAGMAAANRNIEGVRPSRSMRRCRSCGRRGSCCKPCSV
jgi:hypothetical protein